MNPIQKKPLYRAARQIHRRLGNSSEASLKSSLRSAMQHLLEHQARLEGIWQQLQTAEQRVAALLAGDPVCIGRVARATIRSLAFLIVTPPAPLAIDGAAERADVLAYVDRRVANARSIAGNAAALPDTRETAGDRRRQFETLRDELAQGLHTGAAALASDLAGLGADLSPHEGD